MKTGAFGNPRTLLKIFSLLALGVIMSTAHAGLIETIERVKPSTVVIGSYKISGSPQFAMRGTGFVVGDGNLIATNDHVTSEIADAELVVRVGAGPAPGESRLRRARVVATSKAHDLAVLRIEGAPLPAMKLGNSDTVREGQTAAFTGFPIGGALGFSPVTHRATVSSITPLALPGGNSNQLNEKFIQHIKSGTYDIFQLDATAYPGNSGSPLFDVDTGEVIGIINMVFIKGRREAALSQPSGITYAIPSIHLKNLLSQR